MSIHVLSWVLRHSPEEGSARLVLIVLADHAHEDGSNAFPSIETLQREARLKARSTVYRALSGLEERCSITRVGKGSQGQTNWQIEMGVRISDGSEIQSQGGSDIRTGGSEDRTQTVPQPSGQQPSESLPGTDNRRQLIEEYARIFDRPKVTFSSSRMKAAGRAFEEEPDIDVLIAAMQGAQQYHQRQGRSGVPDFTDIFGTRPGGPSLASRINWLAEQADVTSVVPSLLPELKNIPSEAREMVRHRQAHVEAWLKNPGDDRIRDRGERAAAWLRGQFSLVAHATEVGDVVVVEWQREVA